MSRIGLRYQIKIIRKDELGGGKVSYINCFLPADSRGKLHPMIRDSRRKVLRMVLDENWGLYSSTDGYRFGIPIEVRGADMKELREREAEVIEDIRSTLAEVVESRDDSEETLEFEL